jgi:hypothetical protein
LRSTFGCPPFVVPISPSLQCENPLYCIKCWEIWKQEQLGGTLPPTFDSLCRDEMMRHMGVMLDSNAHSSTVSWHINNHVAHLSKYIDEEIMKTIKENLPCPFLTVWCFNAVVQLYRHHLNSQNSTN